MRQIFLVFGIAVTAAFSMVWNSPSAQSHESVDAAVERAVHPEAKQRGCCSWHGGAAGCSGARAMCNDGTISPTCGC